MVGNSSCFCRSSCFVILVLEVVDGFRTRLGMFACLLGEWARLLVDIRVSPPSPPSSCSVIIVSVEGLQGSV